MVAAAMFDQGSFIATQLPREKQIFAPGSELQSGPCIVKPLGLLLKASDRGVCNNLPSDDDDIYRIVTSWLDSFYQPDTQNALHAAVIMASFLWLTSSTRGYGTVDYDMGVDSIRPKISTIGVILVSSLLGLYLFLLLALATYTCLSHTWTSSFDASAMMRIGAARAQELPLRVLSSKEEEKARAVRQLMSGWVGDARPGEDMGVLALGATAQLKAGRGYLPGPG